MVELFHPVFLSYEVKHGLGVFDGLDKCLAVYDKESL